MEDFVTWVDTSKLKRTIMKYNDEVGIPDNFLIHIAPADAISLPSLTTSTSFSQRHAPSPLICSLVYSYRIGSSSLGITCARKYSCVVKHAHHHFNETSI